MPAFHDFDDWRSVQASDVELDQIDAITGAAAFAVNQRLDVFCGQPVCLRNST
jgi:hypothetical protein